MNEIESTPIKQTVIPDSDQKEDVMNFLKNLELSEPVILKSKNERIIATNPGGPTPESLAFKKDIISVPGPAINNNQKNSTPVQQPIAHNLPVTIAHSTKINVSPEISPNPIDFDKVVDAKEGPKQEWSWENVWSTAASGISTAKQMATQVANNDSVKKLVKTSGNTLMELSNHLNQF